MIFKKYFLLLGTLFFGAVFSISTVSANFFIEVDRDNVRSSVNTQLPNSNSDIIHTPDGRFVFLATLASIVVYSRDPETGALEPIFTIDELSFDESGDFAFSARTLAYDADRNLLYARGLFGFALPDDTTDPRLAGLFDIIKLQFDSSSGTLSFADTLEDPDNLIFGSGNVGFELTNDGQYLVVPSANGNEENSALNLVDTENMSVVASVENTPDELLLPGFVNTVVALSPDERFVYMVGTASRSGSIVGMAVVALDMENNSLEVIQSIPVEEFEGDADTDVSQLPALAQAFGVVATADGQFVYTDAEIDAVDSNTSADDVTAIGLWRVTSDGTLAFQRSYDRATLLSEFSDPNRRSTGSGIMLSPGNEDFLYIADDQIFTSLPSTIALLRDTDTGELEFIGGSDGELIRLDSLSVSTDGRTLAVPFFDNQLAVLDTAVDLNATVLSDDFSLMPSSSGTFTVNVTNDGPTSAIGLELLVEAPDGLILSTSDDRCEVVAADQIVCDQRVVLASEQLTVDVAFATPAEEGSHSIVVSTSSKKFEIDDANNSASNTVIVSETAQSMAEDIASTDGNTELGTDAVTDDDENGSGNSGSSGGSGKLQNIELFLLLLIVLSRFYPYAGGIRKING